MIQPNAGFYIRGLCMWAGINYSESDQIVTGQHLSVEVQTGLNKETECL